MKTKLIIGFVALNSLLLPAAFGQSTFQFLNFQPALGIDAPVYDAQGVPLEGPNYVAELWGGAAPDSLTPATTFGGSLPVVVPFYTGTGAGYFESQTTVVILDAYPYFPAWLQVRAWDARLGTTYEQVAALGLGGYGESSLLYLQGGNPLMVPPTAPSPLFGLQSFSLLPVVPEPSTWTLLALGGLAVWWTTRRRR